MIKIFLTSSICKAATSVAQEIDLSTGNKLINIITAAEIELDSESWLQEDKQAMIDAGFAVTDYSITNKSYEQIKYDIKDYDHIHLSGGDVSYLYQKIIVSKFDTLIRELVLNEGKTYLGTSTGSMIAGQVFIDYLLDDQNANILQNKKGFGFVNFAILPHWGSAVFNELYQGGKINIAFQTGQIPLLLLSDDSYLSIKNNNMQIVNINK